MDTPMPPRPTAAQLHGRGGGSRPGGAARGGGRSSRGRGGGRGGGFGGGGGGRGAGKSRFQKPHFKKEQMPTTITVARRVYVGNLSWRTSWQDLKDHFKAVGNVIHADVMMGSDGRSRGCGVVEFDHCNGAVAAIEQLNDSQLDGRPIFVREDREDYELKAAGVVPSSNVVPLYGGRGGGGAAAAGGGGSHAHHAAPRAGGGGGGAAMQHGGSRRVFVSNLAWSTSWQNLKDHFRAAGTVVYADVMCEPSGRSKGFGIVEFETAAEAEQAIATLAESTLDGRPLLVREDERDKEMMGQ